MFASMNGNSQIWTIAWENKISQKTPVGWFILFILWFKSFIFFLLFLKVVKNNYMTIIINWRKDISGTKFIQADCGDRRIYPSIVFPAWKLRKSRIIWAEENSYLRASRFSCVCTQRGKNKQKKNNENSPPTLSGSIKHVKQAGWCFHLVLFQFFCIYFLSHLYMYK